jgi:hypothetical protein
MLALVLQRLDNNPILQVFLLMMRYYEWMDHLAISGDQNPFQPRQYRSHQGFINRNNAVQMNSQEDIGVS